VAESIIVPEHLEALARAQGFDPSPDGQPRIGVTGSKSVPGSRFSIMHSDDPALLEYAVRSGILPLARGIVPEPVLRIRTVGFPRINTQRWPGEIREFSPDYIGRLLTSVPWLSVNIEEDYGSGMALVKGAEGSYSWSSYQALKERFPGRVSFGGHREAYRQDAAFVFKYSEPDELGEMRPGSSLVSMIHYPSRPDRVQYLMEHGIQGLSLDSIVGPDGREVYDPRGTSITGEVLGYEIAKRMTDGFRGIDKLKVVFLGAGGVGSNAIRVWDTIDAMHPDDPPVVMIALGSSAMYDESIRQEAIRGAHVLVDAAYRSDPTKSIVTAEEFSSMALRVLVDLAGDEYDGNVVKAVEGIRVLGTLDNLIYMLTPDSQEPMGFGYSKVEYKKGWPSVDLSGFEFSPDEGYVVTCGSWPGVLPIRFLEVYEPKMTELLVPFLQEGPYFIAPKNGGAHPAMTGLLTYQLPLLLSKPDFREKLPSSFLERFSYWDQEKV